MHAIMQPITPRLPLLSLMLLGLAGWLAAAPAVAGTILKDPQGFNGIAWGSRLTESAELELVQPGERVREYNVTRTPLLLGDVPVDSIRYVTIDGKFARAVIRYRGQETHERILSHLVSHLGPIEQAQILRSLSQPLNWRGDATEVSVIFQDRAQRGLIFFESRELASAFTDSLGDTTN
jgi:hypothetical protein